MNNPYNNTGGTFFNQNKYPNNNNNNNYNNQQYTGVVYTPSQWEAWYKQLQTHYEELYNKYNKLKTENDNCKFECSRLYRDNQVKSLDEDNLRKNNESLRNEINQYLSDKKRISEENEELRQEIKMLKLQLAEYKKNADFLVNKNPSQIRDEGICDDLNYLKRANAYLEDNTESISFYNQKNMKKNSLGKSQADIKKVEVITPNVSESFDLKKSDSSVAKVLSTEKTREMNNYSKSVEIDNNNFVSKDVVAANQPQEIQENVSLSGLDYLSKYNALATNYVKGMAGRKKRMEFYKLFSLHTCANAEEVMNSSSVQPVFTETDSANSADFLATREPNGNNYVFLPVIKGVYESAWYMIVSSVFDVKKYDNGSYSNLKVLKPALISSSWKVIQKGSIMLID